MSSCELIQIFSTIHCEVIKSYSYWVMNLPWVPLLLPVVCPRTWWPSCWWGPEPWGCPGTSSCSEGSGWCPGMLQPPQGPVQSYDSINIKCLFCIFLILRVFNSAFQLFCIILQEYKIISTNFLSQFHLVYIFPKNKSGILKSMRCAFCDFTQILIPGVYGNTNLQYLMLYCRSI